SRSGCCAASRTSDSAPWPPVRHWWPRRPSQLRSLRAPILPVELGTAAIADGMRDLRRRMRREILVHAAPVTGVVAHALAVRADRDEARERAHLPEGSLQLAMAAQQRNDEGQRDRQDRRDGERE